MNFAQDDKSEEMIPPTEKTETAYMGEPEESNEPKHDTEYNKGRQGPHIGRATKHEHHAGEKKETA